MNNSEMLIKSLNEINYKFDDLTLKEKDYLLKIDAVISEIFQREQKARDLLTNNHLSINSISIKAGIARQTIYNNSVLKDYILIKASEFKQIDLSVSNQDLIIRNSILSEQVELMKHRDSEIEELKLEVKNLSLRLKEKELLISRLVNKKT